MYNMKYRLVKEQDNRAEKFQQQRIKAFDEIESNKEIENYKNILFLLSLRSIFELNLANESDCFIYLPYLFCPNLPPITKGGGVARPLII